MMRLPRWIAHTLIGIACARLTLFAAGVSEARRSAAGAPRHPPAGASSHALLLLGDSLAVGIGASSPANTLGGQLSEEFRGVGIECRAAVGARVRDLPAQLALASRNRYQAIVVCIGGNDIVRATPLPAFRARLARALDLCARHSSCVIVTNCANLGGAPLFFWPWSRWLDNRSLQVRQMMDSLCREHRARFVNFCLEPERDIFRRDPERYFSADGIHPTAYAYRLCYQHLVRRGRLREHLGRVAVPHWTGNVRLSAN